MNTSELLVQCLENEGVQYVFGVPGEENILFLEALRTSSIKYITTADERGAAFMAAAYGRLTGKPGVVATTIGPGALNIPNGLAFAFLSGIPLIALTWQNGLRENSKSNDYQYIDVQKVLNPIVKSQKTITTPEMIPTVVRSAFKTAMTPKNGPVHLEIPTDISMEEVIADCSPLPITTNSINIPTQHDIDVAISILNKARCPLIIAGFGTTSSDIPQEVLNFINKSKIFTITTPMAQGVIPADHAYSLFSFSSQQKTFLHKAIDQADIILTIGMNTLEYNPALWNPSNDKTIIHIDTHPATLCNGYNPEMELLGSISHILQLVGQGITKRNYSEYNLFRKVKELLSTREDHSAHFPIHPQYLVNSLREKSQNTIFVHDNGMHKLWMTQFFHPDNSNQVLIDNTLASMASGLAQAVVVKLLYPEKDVVVNIGDGGLLMSMGELATIAHYNLDIKVIVWHDNEYGMIQWHQEKNNLPQYGIALPNVDFSKLAESFGGTGMKVSSAEDLVPTLHKAKRNTGLTIVDCPIDYSDNMKVFSSKNQLQEAPHYATQ